MLWEPVSCGHRYLTILTHFQALWCFWTLSNYSGAFSRPNSHWRCCRQHAKTRFITQSEPSILPTARAVCRLTCGFIGSFQLVFVITQLVKELPAAALRAGVCYGWSGCTLTDSLGLCKHPAMTVPFCVVRWDDSQKPNSMWSSFFLSFFSPCFFFFLLVLKNMWLCSCMPQSVQTRSRHSSGRFANLTSTYITAGFTAYLFWLNFSDFF